MIKRILGRNSGMTMVEIMLSFGILAFASLVTISVVKQKEVYDQKSGDVPRIHNLNENVISGMRRMLVNPKGENPTARNRDGLCRLIFAENESLATGEVKMEVYPPDAESLSHLPAEWTDDQGESHSRMFTSEDWVSNIDGWILMPEEEERPEECGEDHNWKKCLKLSAASTVDFGKSRIEGKSVVAVAEIIPVAVNPFGVSESSGMFMPLAAEDFGVVDSKDVAFILVTTIHYNVFAGQNSNARDKATLQELVWAGDMNHCLDSSEVLADGTTVLKKLSPSGSGLGDPEGTAIFNISAYGNNGYEFLLPPPVRLSFQKIQATRGRVDNENAVVGTDIQSNLVGSCNEIKYQCANVGSNTDSQREYQPVRMSMEVVYNWPNTMVESDRNHRDAEFFPDLKIEKSDGSGGGVQLINPDQTDMYVQIDGRLYSENPEGSGRAKSQDDDSVPLRIGDANLGTRQHVMNITLFDKGLGDFLNGVDAQANNLCRNVCVSSTNYNNQNTETQEYRAGLHYSFPDFQNTQAPDSTGVFYADRFGCTACYTKNCDRLGLGTFGPMEDQPLEPDDGSIPECEIQRGNAVNHIVPLNMNTINLENPGDIPNSGKKCVSANIIDDGQSLSYKIEECSNQKPVMCFNWGKHLVPPLVTARMGFNDPEPVISSSIQSHEFAKGNYACFQSSWTSIEHKAMKARFEGGNGSSNHLDKINRVLRPASAFGTNSTNDPDAPAIYMFFNVAEQGSFQAPQTSNQIETTLKYYAGEADSESFGSGFWIGLRKDDGGQFYAQIPFMTSHDWAGFDINNLVQGDTSASAQSLVRGKFGDMSSSNPNREGAIDNSAHYALFYDGFGMLTTREYDFHLTPITASATVRGALLFHHIRYRGVYPALPSGQTFGAGGPTGDPTPSGASPDNQYRFLCRKTVEPFELFVTSAKSNQMAEGPAKCSAEGGYFLPPTTSLGWTKAMTLAQPLPDNHPFPDPEQTTSENVTPIWVAMQGTDTIGEDWNLYPIPEVTKILQGTNATDDPICVNKSGEGVPCGSGPTHVMCQNPVTGFLEVRSGDSCGSQIKITYQSLSGSINIVNRVGWVLASGSADATAKIDITNP